MTDNKPDKPEAATTSQPTTGKAETVAGSGPKISVVDRSVLPQATPELTPQQLQALRSKLHNKFH